MECGGLTKNKQHYAIKAVEEHSVLTNVFSVFYRSWKKNKYSDGTVLHGCSLFCLVMQCSSCSGGPVWTVWVSGGRRWELQDEHEGEVGPLQQAVRIWKEWLRSRWRATREAKTERGPVPHPAYHRGRSQSGEEKMSQSLVLILNIWVTTFNFPLRSIK